MSKHTAGPWSVEFTENRFQKPEVHASRRLLCVASELGNGDEAIANAILIAAAPELLEAVVKLQTAIGNICGAFHVTESDLLEEDTGAVEACNFSDEVLKKAKGIA